MLQGSHTLQKASFVQHTAKAHKLESQVSEGSTESLATTNRFVTLCCQTLSSELQQGALPMLLRYLCMSCTVLQETSITHLVVINIGDFAIYWGNADEKLVGGLAVAGTNDSKNLVEEFGSTLLRSAFV
ncbi:hypothetical protein RB195_015573 [Necator americanus]|uniref:Uncharacterized protein n=1 Tax=Necator americanus TaxID=51031 RepID=A0ABR1E573_NECAM